MASSEEKEHRLVEMVNIFASRLPLGIEIRQGYYGANNLLSLDDKYIIHCIKRNEVVRSYSKPSKLFHIPLSSTLQFGILHDGAPDENEGVIFNSVHEILALETLPKSLCVVSSKDGQSQVLKENEILLVQMIITPRSGEKSLLVYSTLMKTTKILSSNIVAEFSTKPSLVRLNLSDIVHHLTNPFPCQVLVFEPEGSAALSSQSHQLIQRFLKTPIVLSDRHTEISLIASEFSTCSPGESVFSQPRKRLLDVPVDGDMSDVQIHIVAADDPERVLKDTKAIIESYHLQVVKSLRDQKGGSMAKLQQVLRSAVRAGKERAMGITFESSLGVICPYPYESSTESNTLSGSSMLHHDYETNVSESIDNDDMTVYEDIEIRSRDEEPSPRGNDATTSEQLDYVELVSPLTMAKSMVKPTPPSVPARKPKKLDSKTSPRHNTVTALPALPKPPKRPRSQAYKSLSSEFQEPPGQPSEATKDVPAVGRSAPPVAPRPRKVQSVVKADFTSDSSSPPAPESAIYDIPESLEELSFVDTNSSVPGVPPLVMPGGMLTPYQTDEPVFQPPLQPAYSARSELRNGFETPKPWQISAASGDGHSSDPSRCECSRSLERNIAEIQSAIESLLKRMETVESTVSSERNKGLEHCPGESKEDAALRNKQLMETLTSDQVSL